MTFDIRGAAEALETVRDNVERVAALGEWSANEHAKGRLIGRVPQDNDGEDEVLAPGFDAGIACALSMIPEDKQRLSAVLHAAYTPEAIAQLRGELENMTPGTETTWWLAASSLCEEGNISVLSFMAQVRQFEQLMLDPAKRLMAAKAEWNKLKGSFQDMNGVAYTTVDGGMQAGYIAGHKLAVGYAENYGIHFVGTYLPSLGLEDFEWSDVCDKQGRSTSGLLGPNFAKVGDLVELGEVIKIARAHLKI